MSNFTQDSERLDDGKALKAMETQAINAVNILKQVKVNIVALKSKVNTNVSGVYTADDEAKIQSVIDAVSADIATII